MKEVYKALILFLILGNFSCKKYLDQKPDKKLVVPTTIQDAQALLDNTRTMSIIYPSAGELSGDDYYVLPDDWTSANTTTERNCYIWGRDVFNDYDHNDWSGPYLAVYFSNIILDALKENDFTGGSVSDNANIKGQALLFRSYAFYSLLEIFAKQYDAATASTDLGIALRLSSDFNEPTTRETVQTCYTQLINDAKESIALLPAVQPVLTRPSKAAAEGFLARVFLSMSKFNEALPYADSALQLNNTLIDYNTLDSNSYAPFQRYNPEVLFHTLLIVRGLLFPPTQKVDSTLYQSYNTEDLRRSMFFQANGDGTYSFKGSYDGSIILFGGIATDELYLVRAECYARMDNAAAAMRELNTLLVHRWKTGTFVPLVAVDSREALNIILGERRKELIFRGLRWQDLKRLNMEPAYAKTITRNIAGEVYTLPPNDNRYVLPIPDGIIRLTGMPQNPR